MDDIYTRFSFEIEQIETEEELNILTKDDATTKKDIISQDIGIDNLNYDESNAMKNQLKIVLHELEKLKHMNDVYTLLQEVKTKKRDLILHNMEHLEDEYIDELDLIQLRNLPKHLRDVSEERRICKYNTACYGQLNDILNSNNVNSVQTFINVLGKVIEKNKTKKIEDYKGYLEDAEDWERNKKLIEVETENMNEQEITKAIDGLKKDYNKLLRYKHKIYGLNTIYNNKKEQII